MMTLRTSSSLAQSSNCWLWRLLIHDFVVYQKEKWFWNCCVFPCVQISAGPMLGRHLVRFGMVILDT